MGRHDDLHDERDVYALLDHELDEAQREPQRWVGVTRSPYRVPEPEEGPLRSPPNPAGWGDG